MCSPASLLNSLSILYGDSKVPGQSVMAALCSDDVTSRSYTEIDCVTPHSTTLEKVLWNIVR